MTQVKARKHPVFLLMRPTASMGNYHNIYVNNPREFGMRRFGGVELQTYVAKISVRSFPRVDAFLGCSGLYLRRREPSAKLRVVTRGSSRTRGLCIVSGEKWLIALIRRRPDFMPKRAVRAKKQVRTAAKTEKLDWRRRAGVAFGRAIARHLVVSRGDARDIGQQTENLLVWHVDDGVRYQMRSAATAKPLACAGTCRRNSARSSEMSRNPAIAEDRPDCPTRISQSYRTGHRGALTTTLMRSGGGGSERLGIPAALRTLDRSRGCTTIDPSTCSKAATGVVRPLLAEKTRYQMSKTFESHLCFQEELVWSA